MRASTAECPMSDDEAVDPIDAAREMFWKRMVSGDGDAATWAVAFALMEVADRCDDIATDLRKLRQHDPE